VKAWLLFQDANLFLTVIIANGMDAILVREAMSPEVVSEIEHLSTYLNDLSEFRMFPSVLLANRYKIDRLLNLSSW